MVATYRRSREVRFLQACLGLHVLVVLPFFIVERFRLPWAPLLSVFAASALVHGVVELRRRRPAAVRGAIAFLILVMGCNMPVWGVRRSLQFDLDYKIGYAYQQRGEQQAAMQAYRRSISHNPHSAMARNALGYMLARQGEDLDEAVRLIEAALRLDPQHTANYCESLAFAQLQRRDAQAALQACERGLATPAGSAPTRAALLWRRAQTYRLLADPDAEIRALDEALQMAPQGEHAAAIRSRLEELAPGQD
jgi:tetratricopeptide (TPR) repeat protein